MKSKYTRIVFQYLQQIGEKLWITYILYQILASTNKSKIVKTLWLGSIHKFQMFVLIKSLMWLSFRISALLLVQYCESSRSKTVMVFLVSIINMSNKFCYKSFNQNMFFPIEKSLIYLQLNVFNVYSQIFLSGTDKIWHQGNTGILNQQMIRH